MSTYRTSPDPSNLPAMELRVEEVKIRSEGKGKAEKSQVIDSRNITSPISSLAGIGAVQRGP